MMCPTKGSLLRFALPFALLLLVSTVPPASASNWRYTTASTYGYCGISGEPCGGMACNGKRVTRLTWAVANRTLRCGTLLRVCVRTRCRRVRVQDRGPFVAGRDIDLTWRVGRALHIDGIARARWRVIPG